MVKGSWKQAHKYTPIYTGKVTFSSHNKEKEEEVWVESTSFSKPQKVRSSRSQKVKRAGVPGLKFF